MRRSTRDTQRSPNFHYLRSRWSTSSCFVDNCRVLVRFDDFPFLSPPTLYPLTDQAAIIRFRRPIPLIYV